VYLLMKNLILKQWVFDMTLYRRVSLSGERGTPSVTIGTVTIHTIPYLL
jgi:hypothetical protein